MRKRSFVRVPWWPLGVLPLALSGLLVAFAAWWGTWGMRAWPFQEWQRTSGQFAEQFVLAGPVAAGSACYVAVRLAASGRVFGCVSGVRQGNAVAVRQIGLLAAVHVTGYALGLLPLLLLSASAPYGGPAWPVIGVGLLALGAATACGYAVGALAGSIVAVPGVMVVALALGSPTTVGESVLTPPLLTLPPLGMHESPAVTSFRLAFFASIAVAALLWSGWAVASRARRAGVFGLSLAIAAGVVPGVLGAAAIASPPVLFVPDSSAPAVCRRDAGVEYCVHQGHREVLDTLVEQAAPVVARYGPPAGSRLRIEDAALSGAKPTGSAVRIALDPETFDRENLGWEVALALVLGPCQDRSDAPGRGRYLSDVAGWLAGEGPERRAGGRFGGMDDAALGRWFAQHRERIATCRLSERDLP